MTDTMTTSTDVATERSATGKSAPLRLLVVDDEALIREAFCLLVGAFEGVMVVGEAADGRAAIDMVAKTRPDVVLMDLRMPVMDGVEATRKIRAEWPETRVIALTALSDGQMITTALEIQMDGYVLKKASRQELRLAIEMAMAGSRYLSPDIAEFITGAFLAEQRHGVSPLKTVTLRESEVLELIRTGLRGKAIADRLGISIKTVEKHSDNLRRKFKVNTQAELVEVYQRLVKEKG
jgi:DNA-binding NarL/FixJ family response regulator